MPIIPQRPSRNSQSVPETNAVLAAGETPHIPPRPARRADRSSSPRRFASSPLNEAPIQLHGNVGKSSLYSSESASNSDAELTRTTSHVEMPSVGEEGHEYADLLNTDKELGSSPQEARSVGDEVKLHAPKPSLTAAVAKQRLAAVTRTESSNSVTNEGKSLKNKASFTSQASNGASESVPTNYDSDSGIPEIGQQVPMYPHAGDVQAPSPGPGSMPFSPGIGFYNDGSKTPSIHARKTSQVNFDMPPDSYGKHGHGVMPHDRFEKAYYEKHPELLKKEVDLFHEKAEWAMSSEDLNRIVRETASRAAEKGTSSKVKGIPSEQIGFAASEEYASRMASPRIQPADSSQGAPHDLSAQGRFESALSQGLKSQKSHEDVIHVDAPEHFRHKIHGGDIPPGSPNALGVQHDLSGDDGEVREQFAYSAPILAEDEVAKTPLGSFMEPAVSPRLEHRSGSHDEGSNFYKQKTGSAVSISGSQGAGRSGSAAERWGSVDHTRVENVQVYEPLFPDDKDDTQAKPIGITSKHHPDLHSRKFPSQDVWEDTPNSLQYTATVSTPEPPKQSSDRDVEEDKEENIGRAFAKHQAELAEGEAKTPDSFLGPTKKAKGHGPEIPTLESRSSSHRFPSRDIWEDSPDSLQLQTTVETPQDEEKTFDGIGETSPVEAVPKTAVQPQIPERPARTGSYPPVPSSKPKPQVPVRPTRAKPPTRESSENIPLAQVASDSSAKGNSSEAASVKPKPPVPSRPVGGKIAALQGGFMADLNKRLQLGPKTTKAEEVESEVGESKEDKVPLADARKSRARGPQRRAPVAVKAEESTSKERPAASLELSQSSVQTWFVIDPELESAPVSTNPAGDDLHSDKKFAPQQSDTNPSADEPDHPAVLDSSKHHTVDTDSDTPASADHDEEEENLTAEGVPGGFKDE